MHAFLRQYGLGEFDIRPLDADASSRHYFRITTKPRNESFVLMNAPPEQHDLQAFTAIAEHLRVMGLSPPRIHAQDFQHGFLLLQDFGDDSFSRLLAQKTPAYILYEAAIDVLSHLHSHPTNATLDLPAYDSEALIKEAALFGQWYVPHVCKVQLSSDLNQEYLQIWQDIILALPTDKSCLVLRDYHADNVMQIQGLQLGRDEAIAACGLLDFQDALLGSPAYDVMSILEDARVDISPELQNAMLKRYFANRNALASPIDKQAFHENYSVLAAIRHAKVLGIFVRLQYRDNKHQYQNHLPRVHSLFKKHLHKNPALKPLQAWLTKHLPDF